MKLDGWLDLREQFILPFDQGTNVTKRSLKIAGERGTSNEVGALNDNLGFHIRLAHGAVYRHFSMAFSTLGLTQKQAGVLWLIDDHPGIAQTDLARRLQMDRATTMGIVNRLQARGYLRRDPSISDRRRQALFLNPEGEGALKDAKAAILEHEAWLKARFTAREVDTLVALLVRIHGDPMLSDNGE